jgi:hypothetical protein
MDTMFFAKVFGPLLLFFGLANIFLRGSMTKTAKLFTTASEGSGLLWMESYLSMFIGLAIACATFGAFSAHYGVLVPIYGFICFVKGVLLLFFGKPFSALWGNLPNLIMIGALRIVFALAFIHIGYCS